MGGLRSRGAARNGFARPSSCSDRSQKTLQLKTDLPLVPDVLAAYLCSYCPRTVRAYHFFLGTYEIAAIQNSSRLNFLDVVQTRLQELAQNFGICTLLWDGS